MSKVSQLKTKLIDRLLSALDEVHKITKTSEDGTETIETYDAKSFAAVANAALATIKAFHSEVGEEVSQQSSVVSSLLTRYQEVKGHKAN